MNTKVIIFIVLAAIALSTVPLSSAFAQQTDAPLSSGSAQIKGLVTQIDRKIEALNKEANRATSIKDYLIPSEYSAVISDIQASIQKLETLKKQAGTFSKRELQQKINELRINTKIIPRVQLRRRAALLYAYNTALAIKIQEFSQKIQSLQSNQTEYTQAKKCIEAAETKRTEGLGLLNGVLSQIGLFEATQQSNARPLYFKLQEQLRKAKKSFDQSRGDMNKCYRQFVEKPKNIK